MKTSQNTSSENTENSEIGKKISKILNLKKGTFEELVEKKGLKLSILDILKNDIYRKNKALALFLIQEVEWKYISQIHEKVINKKIVQIALLQSADAEMFIPDRLKKDTSVAENIILAFIKFGKNFFEVEKFLEKHFGGLKNVLKYERLFQFYDKNLQLSEKLNLDDLSKGLFLIKKSDEVFYKFLKTQKIIEGQGKKIVLSQKFINIFVTGLLNSEDFQQKKDIGEQQTYKKVLLSFLLQVDLQNMGSDSLYVFNLLFSLCNAEYDKTLRPKKEEEEIGKDDEKIIDDGDDDENEFGYDEKIDFCYPPCSYTSISSGGYNIHISGAAQLQISKDELSVSTAKSLENYIYFYSTLTDLGLNFLWDKYKTKFITACSNHFHFDYLSGEGVTRSKLLSVLNFVGKTVGIPEQTYSIEKTSGDDNDEAIDVGCFKSIWEARLLFLDIKKTGIVNGTFIDNPGDFSDRSIVEKTMIQKDLINDKGGFNLNKWGG